MKRYFEDSFRQLNTAITMPINAVIGPMTDQVVVLLIGLPKYAESLKRPDQTEECDDQPERKENCESLLIWRS